MTKKKELTLFAYAKINFYLDVTSRRYDGYHNISSVMQTVSLFDRIRVSYLHTDSLKITQTCSRADIPIDSSNLCYKAVTEFSKRVGMNGNVEIDIDKHIPSSAGLAGGSSDAAAVLRALNQLTGAKLNISELCDIGLRIGSDLPFCLIGGTCAVGGRGEYVRKIGSFPDLPILIVKSLNESVSTRDGYAAVDSYLECKHKLPPDFSKYVAAFENGMLATILSDAYNVFECALLDTLPETAALMRKLDATNPLSVRMSGSGPSVFAVYGDVQSAYAAKEQLGGEYESFVCMPVCEI